jgi:hypothetical protein
VAACNLWSNAFNANALLLSASALALPGVPLCTIVSPLDAETSAAENGVHIFSDTRTV